MRHPHEYRRYNVGEHSGAKRVSVVVESGDIQRGVFPPCGGGEISVRAGQRLRQLLVTRGFVCVGPAPERAPGMAVVGAGGPSCQPDL